MLLKYFYDKALAHASYMVGCQRTKEAIIVDPARDIEQYFDAARREGVKIVAVAETHIHADYVSGVREFADRTGAKMYVSDEGPAEWKYQFANQYDHQLLKDGDTFDIGNIEFRVMHTPGHTPESISFLITDRGGNADKPMGIFTGDFVFVGSIGRPDLLEKAAAIANTAEPGARDLFKSAQKFKQLPDYLQVWPAHGAGSACGKGLGAIPSSTVGYEKLFNPALQYNDEDEFVAYILSDQPEAPKYFAVMKRVNKEGPQLIGDATLPALTSVDKLTDRIENAVVIDIASAEQFARGHVPHTINIPASMLAGWAGWLIDYTQPVYLVADAAQLPEAMRILHKIGCDNVQGYFDVVQLRDAGLLTETLPTETPSQLRQRIESDAVELIDVRSQEEWNGGRIHQARHCFLGKLDECISDFNGDRTVVLQCAAGGRSAIAASMLQAAGMDVINMDGGFSRWRSEGLPTDNSPVTDAKPQTSQVV
jgi:hydroxyacylglutathione hydrolase